MNKFFLVVIAFLFVSCDTISKYDTTAYSNVNNVKVEAQHLILQATDNYKNHTKEIDQWQLDCDKAYSYEVNRPLNIITIKMWDIIRDPNGGLMGSFLERWKQQDHFGITYCKFKAKQVGNSFDKIAQLESGKIHQ